MLYSDIVNHFVFPVVYKDSSVNQFVLNTGKTLRVHKDVDISSIVNNMDEVEWVSFRGAFKLKNGAIYIYADGNFIPYAYNETNHLYYPADKASSLPAVLKTLAPDIEPNDSLKEAITLILYRHADVENKSTREVLEKITKKIGPKNAHSWMRKFGRFYEYLIAIANNPMADVIPPSEF